MLAGNVIAGLLDSLPPDDDRDIFKLQIERM